jgi:ubiquinone/menaquinone biosynthesis C-methylase UbiE
MEEITANDDLERFRNGAAKYAAYLETPEGRLRLDLAFASLQDFLPQTTHSLHALDIGCGTGALGVRLARLGLNVTLLDGSESMLDFANRAAQEAGVSGKIALKHGDASQLADLFDAGSFDVIVCHNVLEFVDDPSAVLRGAARALRDSSSIISVLVRNQAGEVYWAAIWRRPNTFLPRSGAMRHFTAAKCGCLRRMACKLCCSNHHSRSPRSVAYACCRITCSRRSPEMTSTPEFWNWSANLARARTLRQSPAIRIASHVAQAQVTQATR